VEERNETDELHCERCGEKLNPTKAVWLDLSWRSNLYSAKPWPEDESQGGFPFGAACSRAILREQQ